MSLNFAVVKDPKSCGVVPLRRTLGFELRILVARTLHAIETPKVTARTFANRIETVAWGLARANPPSWPHLHADLWLPVLDTYDVERFGKLKIMGAVGLAPHYKRVPHSCKSLPSFE